MASTLPATFDCTAFSLIHLSGSVPYVRNQGHWFSPRFLPSSDLKSPQKQGGQNPKGHSVLSAASYHCV